jgi:hypothetical protein
MNYQASRRRFAAANHHAGSRGSGEDYPNGQQLACEDGLRGSTLLPRPDAVEWSGLTAAEIGDPAEADRVYGASLLGSGAGERRDLGGRSIRRPVVTSKPDYVVLRAGIPNVDGWVIVWIAADGTVTFSGHVYNGCIDAMSFRIGVLVDAGSVSLALFCEGKAGGLASGDPRDAHWEQTHRNPFVTKVFRALGTASLEVSADVQGAITGFIEDAATAIGRWIAGVLVDPAPMLLISIGAVADAAVSGNPSGGARLVDGRLWLAGPGGTLIALASDGTAVLGSRERRISDAEYDWANNTLFGGRLPPRQRIIITDTAGGGGRAFVYPRFDGCITLNLGPTYDNPMSDRGRLIHALTHAWQLGNTVSDVDYITANIGARACELFGTDPYPLPPGTPAFRDLNLEQQAMVVEIWIRQPPAARPGHPYNRYVVENIRTGIP